MTLYLNTLLNSELHIPVYAGLLRVNVTLFLRVTTRSLSNILREI